MVMLPILFVLLFVSCLGGLITQQTFFSRLRKLHTSTWEELGKPVIFLNSGIPNAARFIKFMWNRSYESLPNQRTVAFGRFLRAFLIFYVTQFVLTVIAFLLVLKQHK